MAGAEPLIVERSPPLKREAQDGGLDGPNKN